MKRRSFFAIAGLSGAAVTLSACSGGDTKSDSGPITKDTKAELTLFYWDKEQTPTVEANIKAFNVAYPNITVTPSIAAYKEYFTKLRTQAEGKQLPDVFWMNGPNIQLYASNDMLAPLDDLSDVDWAKYPEALVELYTVDGKHYGVPKDYDTIACIINTALFEKHGVEIPTGEWTWEELNAAAAKIAAGGDMGVVASLNDSQATYYNTIAQAGGYVIKDNKSGFADPKSVAGLQMWTDLIADGSMPSLQVLSDSKPVTLFTAGKAGIFWTGSWTIKPLLDDFPDKSQVLVVPLPKGEQRATVIHGVSYVAAANSKNLVAAKALVAAMTNEKANQTEASNGTAIPAYTGTQTAWLDLQKDWKLDVFTTAAEEYAVPYPVSKNTSAWANLESEILPNVFSGAKPAEEAGKELAEKMDALLAKE